MAIQGVSANPVNNVKQAQDKNKISNNQVSTPAEVKNQDIFVKEEKIEQVTYDKPKGMAFEEIKALEEQRAAEFKQMLQSMLGKQGEAYNLTLFGFTGTGKANYQASADDIAKAQAAIAPGGAYSVDAVATRIMDMAEALSGGDPSKIDVLRKAVQDGFKAAGLEFGQAMPDITGQTYDEIMKRFDEWEKSSKSDDK